MSRKRLTTIHDPTVNSNMSSVYEPNDFRESIDIPSVINSPKFFRISANQWKDFEQAEDNFRQFPARHSPPYKSQHKSSLNIREFASGLDPWKTFDIQPNKGFRSPTKVNPFFLPETKHKDPDGPGEDVQAQLISYIEGLELQNVELENKIRVFQEGRESKNVN